MREIKFRGLRTDGKGWAYGALHYWVFNPGSFVNGSEVIPETIGQFTGKYGYWDKLKVEVYDGDMFRNDPVGEGDFTFLVEWDEERAGWVATCVENDVYTLPLGEYMAVDIEIIGNIHEKESELT